VNLPFVAARRERWAKLNHYIEKSAREKLTAFTADELMEFSMLYRRTSSDLALAKTLRLPAELVGFLNDLTGRAYHQLYRSELSRLQQIKALLCREFPLLIRQNERIILFSLGLMLVGWVFGFCGYLTGPQTVSRIIPPSLSQGLIEDFEANSWFNDPVTARPYISARIMYNNIQVSLLAFAGGMLLGIYTLFLVVFNGFMLGVLSAAFWQKSYLISFWAMILPHGVIELTAIAMAASGGFLLAKTILYPGEYSRADALKVYGTTAVKLMAGTVVMLIIAGLIEGFFSTIATKVIPEWVRLLFAAGTGLLLLGYLRLGSGKTSK
jgi:uncharacterized membrane protein SpoIIM required for sporulation